jgi:hypothetical protein
MQISGRDAFLEAAFKEHGPPLFFKRDNGSSFNCCEVDQVLARYWVLPLNNPPAYPRYNGAMEKSIRDLRFGPACLAVASPSGSTLGSTGGQHPSSQSSASPLHPGQDPLRMLP